jgi:hypothetical protein
MAEPGKAGSFASTEASSGGHSGSMRGIGFMRSPP